MDKRILVINPNSSVAVTRAMDRALDPLRSADGPAIECVTMHEGPPGIETQLQVDAASAPLCKLVAARDNEVAAFVVACFSDPGVYAAREITRRPVFGIAESGILTALGLGSRFGIIAILATSIPRHLRHIRALGFEGRLAGDLPIGLGVTELAKEEETFRRMADIGRELRDERGADVVVLGCAGMARYRERLEDKLSLPVVDPTQAAVGMAIAVTRIGYAVKARRTA